MPPQHRESEENRYRMPAVGIGQAHLRYLLDSEVSERALHEFFTAARKDQALTSGRRILDLRGENLSPVVLASELKIDRNAFGLVHKACSRKGVLRNRIE